MKIQHLTVDDTPVQAEFLIEANQVVLRAVYVKGVSVGHLLNNDAVQNIKSQLAFKYINHAA